MPQWTREVARRALVFSDTRGGVLNPSAVYSPALKRYFFAVPHRTPSQPYGGLGVFDAPEPWGPWTTVYYTDAFMGDTTLFFANFPAKWISTDGPIMYLIFTDYGRGAARGAYQHIRRVLTLRGTPPVGTGTRPRAPQAE
jgi:hypothetical protein